MSPILEALREARAKLDAEIGAVEHVDMAAEETRLDEAALAAWEQHVHERHEDQSLLAEEARQIAVVEDNAKRLTGSINRLTELQSQIRGRAQGAFGWAFPFGHTALRELVVYLARTLPWLGAHVHLTLYSAHKAELTSLESTVGPAVERHLRSPSVGELTGFGIAPEVAERIIRLLSARAEKEASS